MSPNSGDRIAVPPEALTSVVSGIFAAWGLPRHGARTAAEVLATADLRDRPSQGCSRLPTYYRRLIESGAVNLRARPRLLRRRGPMETWDGGEGLGLALAPGIMARVIASAGRRGLGMAWLTGSSHFGLASYYTLAAASAGLAGLVMTNGHPAVAPPGAQAAVTGTNAVSLALPGEGKASLVIDLATSNTSLGNLEQRAAAGEKAPAHWAAEALQARLGLGPDDLADPEVLRSERMLSALGGGRGSDGYKGFALALLVESLTALLPGGRPSPKLGPGQACHFFLAISPGAVWAGPGAGVGPGASQDAEAGAAIDRAVSDLGGTLARTPVLGGYPPLRLPGRRGNLAEAERRVRGIPFPREVVSALVGLAEELGVDAGPLAEGLGVDAGRTPAPPVARPQSR